MDEEEEFDSDKLPIVLNIDVKLKFPQTGGIINECMELKVSEGLFGNEEPTAKLSVTGVENEDALSELGKQLGIDSEAFRVAEHEMPLTTWLARLVAVLRHTASNPELALVKDTDSDFENEKQYIFKRK